MPCRHSPAVLIEAMQQKVKKHRLNPSTQARQSAQKQKISPVPFTEHTDHPRPPCFLILKFAVLSAKNRSDGTITYRSNTKLIILSTSHTPKIKKVHSYRTNLIIKQVEALTRSTLVRQYLKQTGESPTCKYYLRHGTPPVLPVSCP